MSNYIDEILKEIEATRKKAAQESLSKRTDLAIAMQSAGVNIATIEFAGSGDSGCIDDINIEMQDGFDVPEGLKKELEDFAYTYLEGVGVDWYNNEGGQGTISFDLTTFPPAFSASVEVNHMMSETVHEVEREVA